MIELSFLFKILNKKEKRAEFPMSGQIYKKKKRKNISYIL